MTQRAPPPVQIRSKPWTFLTTVPVDLRKNDMRFTFTTSHWRTLPHHHLQLFFSSLQISSVSHSKSSLTRSPHDRGDTLRKAQRTLQAISINGRCHEITKPRWLFPAPSRRGLSAVMNRAPSVHGVTFQQKGTAQFSCNRILFFCNCLQCVCVFKDGSRVSNFKTLTTL